MPEDKKVAEEMYVEPTVEVSGKVVDPLSTDNSALSITICGCCLC